MPEVRRLQGARPRLLIADDRKPAAGPPRALPTESPPPGAKFYSGMYDVYNNE